MEERMFLKLLPEQLVKVWDMVRFAVAETFLPRNKCTNEYLRFMLSNLLSGKSQIWMAFDKVGEDRSFIGFVISRIHVDPAIGERVLTIDSIYAFKKVPEGLFEMGMNTLEEFARKNACKHIVAISDQERIALLATKMKFTTKFFLTKEV